MKHALRRVRFGYPLKRNDDYRKYFHYLITVDGKRFPEHLGYAWADAERPAASYWVHVAKGALRDRLEKCTFSDLHVRPTHWAFTLFDWDALRIDFCYAYPVSELRSYLPKADFIFDSDNWRYPWGIADYGRMCRNVAREILPAEWRCEIEEDIVSNGVRVHFPHPAPADNLGEKLREVAGKIALLNEHVRLRLITKVNEEALVTFFDFAPSEKNPASQYLIYFSEFLRALGMEASLSLTDEGQRLAFTVVPKEGETGLSAVQAALHIYLRLPAAIIADSDINSRDTLIRNLALTIVHFQKLTGVRNTLSHAIRDVPSDRQEVPESFFGGRLAIKKWERGPFTIDLPKIIRDLRRGIPALKRFILKR